MRARAVLLAAGIGSRLMPLTADRPKGMVELIERPLLQRQVDTLRRRGVTDITVVGGYLADRLQSLGCAVVLNPAYETTNMVISLMCARGRLDGTADVVMGYGDIVYEPRVLEAVMATSGDLVVAADSNWRALWSARMEDVDSDVESFRVDAGGRVVELGRRPASLDDVQGQYIGLVKIPAGRQQDLVAAFDTLDREALYDGRPVPTMFMTSFIQHLIDRGWDVRPAWIEGGWLEVDTTEDLDRYHAMAAAGTLDRLYVADGEDATAELRALRDATLERVDPDATDDVSTFVRAAVGRAVLQAADLATLDRLARKVEISGLLPTSVAAADALLATFLLAFEETGDYRHLNTVLKALDGTLKEPRISLASELERWCERALER